MIARVVLGALLLVACQGKAPDPQHDDVPTKGDILIVADQDFQRIIEAERFVFESIYDQATVRVRYLPETALRQAMRNDSVRVVFSATLPGADEVAFFRTRNLYPDHVPVLTDAIAVVRGVNSTDRTISLDEIRRALSGDTSVTVLVEDAQGGIARTVIDSLLEGSTERLRNMAVVPGLDSLLHRLNVTPGAIGLLSFAHISDLDDPACRALRDRMALLAVADDDPPVLPSQSTLADGQYPLRRKLFAVLKEGKTGLGTGFVSFVAGHKGQRIILKSGLAPQTVPGREVELVSN
ncbi:MAG: substrate-binding domain-containing protein [Flavobacteriales bacterium]|jgi:phosphate transport system substrate-binding protein|nr:substrate-binding domain-containing protein [Flavobacteriales bacterium]